ncbi:hypothetical protein RINTU1_34600 [Candidatus Regiella insecticola]|uniref:Uncharacterized protein n=1 Tax=Candidatus Regiella insecticola TaxID=138073 RepID=A0A6L2ZSX3_9ENTR|nr:hypothetical protein RINTU1_34600 [Candidatus Regiella insecticola]
MTLKISATSAKYKLLWEVLQGFPIASESHNQKGEVILVHV